MKKIVITGGLGYIGTELCNLLYQVNWPLADKFKIIVVDNNFNASAVNNLVSKNIYYYQRDLFNIKDLLIDADFVIHLAGITQVPQVESQVTPEKDAAIIKVGVDGTREIIKNIPDHCKIIFASTHVIWEGLIEPILGITEWEKPRPVLAYSSSKFISEVDLINSNKNYVILRLASVYGYNENIRVGIIANLFSKLTAINRKITVFGSDNYKPLVGVYDVARFIFRCIGDEYNKEIFNLVNENLKVKEIANICSEYCPELDIEYTNDKTINTGYTLSNAKVLSTGFKFSQNVNLEIKDMINRWKNK